MKKWQLQIVSCDEMDAGDKLCKSQMGITGLRKVRFGDFEVDLVTCELRKFGARIKLQDQPFKVLSTLLDRPGEIISREELQQKVWPANTFVDFDQSLNKAINKIREALNDSAEGRSYRGS